LRQHRADLAVAPDRELIEGCVERIVLHPAAIEITLRADDSAAEGSAVDALRVDADREVTAPAHPMLRIPWSRAATRRRRQVIAPAQVELSDHRPIRAETRATLVRAIGLGRRWLDELVTGISCTPQAIAQREGCSQRHVERTISLAFLAPDLVQAAVDGRLPRVVGVSRLIDLPPEWQHQWRMLGLPR